MQNGGVGWRPRILNLSVQLNSPHAAYHLNEDLQRNDSGNKVKVTWFNPVRFNKRRVGKI